MKQIALLSSLLATVAGALLFAQVASADQGHGRGAEHLVFVQTNELSGNRVVVYHRGEDGQLTPAGTYATGGNGGAALPGTESDRLASQGSLVYDREHSLLLAVNAGSDSVSAFRVRDDRLSLEDVVPSGGQFPASITVDDNIAYVLNSGGTGIVQGFRIVGHGLQPIPGSARSLGLANSDPPFFLTSPGQVGFTPDGRKLIVTTKASGSTIDVFQVGRNGRLSDVPVANPSATPVPFAFSFDAAGRLVDGEAAASSLTTYTIGSDGVLSDPKSLADGQAALCWVTPARGFYYVSNTASNSVSGYAIGPDGQPSLVTATGIVGTTDAGPIDSASSDEFLYVETGLTSTVDEFHVNGDGTLASIGAVTGLPPGIEGIAAS